MSQKTWVLLLELGVFLTVVFYLGYLGWRRSKGVAGFFVADRQVGPVVLAGEICGGGQIVASCRCCTLSCSWLSPPAAGAISASMPFSQSERTGLPNLPAELGEGRSR